MFIAQRVGLSRVRRALSVAASFAAAGCSFGHETYTSPLLPTHQSRIVGVVYAASGTRMDSVRVTASPLVARGGSLVIDWDLTRGDGVFDIEVGEYASRDGNTEADTVRMVVAAQTMRRAMYDPVGVRGVVRDTVLVSMSPRAHPIRVGMRSEV